MRNWVRAEWEIWAPSPITAPAEVGTRCRFVRCWSRSPLVVMAVSAAALLHMQAPGIWVPGLGVLTRGRVTFSNSLPDVVGDAEPEAIELAECANVLTHDLQAAYRAAIEKKLGFTALSPAENATLTIERAVNAGVSSASNRADAPRCDAPGCDGSALDLGRGSWSGGCLTHISLTDRDRHQMFNISGDHARETADFLRNQLNRGTAIALVNWWGDMGGPQHVLEDAIRSETAFPQAIHQALASIFRAGGVRGR